MRRRDFVKKLSVGAAGGALAACAPGEDGAGSGEAAVAGPRVTWRLASSFPRNLDLLHGAAERFAERVGALTRGRFRIRVYPAGELVPGLQVMDAVQQRTVQAGYTGGYYYIGKSPALAFDSTVPFGLTSRQQFAWLHHGGGLDLLREIYADFGIMPLPCGATGGQMGGWFRRPVESLADLRGLRMRIPGIGGEIMSRLGVTVQVLAGGDIYPALERGAIDAAEWVGPYDDEKLGFHQIASNYYYPGWWEPGLSATLQVGLRAWEALPEAYREVVESVSKEVTFDTLARYDAENPRALLRLVEEHGVRLRAFPADVMQAAWRESNAYLQERADHDPAFRRVFESWSEFRDQAFPYFSGNELHFEAFAFPRVPGPLQTGGPPAAYLPSDGSG